MAELIYEDGLPPSDDFRQALAEALAMTNPVDDLLELADRLREFEEEHKMTSADFFQGYQRGTLDEQLQHCTEWAAVYDLFIKTKRMVEATLMRAAVQAEVTETAA